MYWLLLPPSANAGRQIEAPTLPLRGSWGDRLHAVWGRVLHLLKPVRR